MPSSRKPAFDSLSSREGILTKPKVSGMWWVNAKEAGVVFHQVFYYSNSQRNLFFFCSDGSPTDNKRNRLGLCVWLGRAKRKAILFVQIFFFVNGSFFNTSHLACLSRTAVNRFPSSQSWWKNKNHIMLSKGITCKTEKTKTIFEVFRLTESDFWRI